MSTCAPARRWCVPTCLKLHSLATWCTRPPTTGSFWPLCSKLYSSRLTLPPTFGAEHVAHLYVVRCEERDEARSRLAQMQVQTDVHYPTPDYRQPCLRGKIDDSPLPHTEADARRVMTLPCFPELTDAEVDAVIAACNRL